MLSSYTGEEGKKAAAVKEVNVLPSEFPILLVRRYNDIPHGAAGTFLLGQALEGIAQRQEAIQAYPIFAQNVLSLRAIDICVSDGVYNDSQIITYQSAYQSQTLKVDP